MTTPALPPLLDAWTRAARRQRLHAAIREQGAISLDDASALLEDITYLQRRIIAERAAA